MIMHKHEAENQAIWLKSCMEKKSNRMYSLCYAQEREKEHIGTAFDYKAMQSL